MTLIMDNSFLRQRLFWMVRFRWIAAIFIALETYITHDLLGIAVQEITLYALAVLLCVYNSTLLLFLKHCSRREERLGSKTLTRFSDYQITIDISFLAFLLHSIRGVLRTHSFSSLFSTRSLRVFSSPFGKLLKSHSCSTVVWVDGMAGIFGSYSSLLS